MQQQPDNHRIAVLPLANMSSDAKDEIFSDGMTEELISVLSKIAGLRVIARTSVMRYKDTKKPIGEIGRELNVSAILEGSVRRTGNKIRNHSSASGPENGRTTMDREIRQRPRRYFRSPERDRSEGSRRARNPDQQEREAQPRQESDRQQRGVYSLPRRPPLPKHKNRGWVEEGH